MRLIELSMPDGDRVQQVLKATLQTEPVDHRLTEPDDRGRRLLRLLFKTGDGQKAIDAISAILEDETDWQLVVIPIEASLPKIPEEDETRQQQKTLALREEIYDDISRGGRLNRDYLLLTLLSTLVVVFGMAADNVAVVIGAMVIAPLLGPILAFSFGSALGDLALMLKEKARMGPSSGAITIAPITTATLSAAMPNTCLLYTSPSPRDRTRSRMPSSA